MIDPEERRQYWNDRYGEGSIFGAEPNVFVAEHLAGLPPGRVLDLACGQGRNAVWLALQGHAVTAVDLSDVAIGQAVERADAAGVEIQFVVADVMDWDPDPAAFDVVLLSYLQLEEGRRVVAHRKAAEAVAPGGTVFLIAHHPDNIEHGCGGPQVPDVLFGEADLASDFAGFDIVRNEQVRRAVDRDGVTGTALDVLMIASRPAE